MTVLENLCIPLAYTAPLQDRGTDMTAEAMAILQLIGLEAKAHRRSVHLTLIELRKLELARAMAARPRLLISDEAMAASPVSRSTRSWPFSLHSTNVALALL